MNKQKTFHCRNQLGTESITLLFQAENSKNYALTQHNINDQNYRIANSMRIESDPLSALDSSNFVTQTSKTNTEIIQSCTEGSNFNIELIQELNVECKLEDTWQNRQIAHLAMLNQMSKDIKTNPVSVFSGKHRKCKKDVFSFLNCCSSMTGCGRDIGLSQCKSKEQELALYRKKG